MGPLSISESGRVVVAVLALMLVSLMVGCGGELGCGCDQSTSTTVGPVTSSTSASTTTTAQVTTSVLSSTTTSSTTASSTTTTEALSSAEIRLANGNIRGMGFIDKVWEAGGVRYLRIDYAEFLTGEEARQAAIEAGDIPPDGELDNDYYIRNANPRKRAFTVSASVVITTATRSGGMDEPATWAEFISFWSASPPEGTAHLHDMPWWIERDGTEVISIAEQYIP
jgi:hypothetical protein